MPKGSGVCKKCGREHYNFKPCSSYRPPQPLPPVRWRDSDGWTEWGDNLSLDDSRAFRGHLVVLPPKEKPDGPKEAA